MPRCRSAAVGRASSGTRNMPERSSRGERTPAEFAAILSAAELPLIVGGQAINIWAELYAARVPELEAFAPFTSLDADICSSRALAETLARRAGWEFRPVNERESGVVAILTKATAPGQPPLTIEVLQEVNGLTDADLGLDATIELASGERYRTPSPLVLLKAKLYNLASLANLDRPQDVKHARMLLHIVPQYFNELLAEHRAGKITAANLIGAIRYARDVACASFARNAARAHGFDFRRLLPASLGFAPKEIQKAVQEFMTQMN